MSLFPAVFRRISVAGLGKSWRGETTRSGQVAASSPFRMAVFALRLTKRIFNNWPALFPILYNHRVRSPLLENGEKNMSIEIEMIEEMDKREVLKFLTEFGYLEGAAHGIALQVVAKGRQ